MVFLALDIIGILKYTLVITVPVWLFFAFSDYLKNKKTVSTIDKPKMSVKNDDLIVEKVSFKDILNLTDENIFDAPTNYQTQEIVAIAPIVEKEKIPLRDIHENNIDNFLSRAVDEVTEFDGDNEVTNVEYNYLSIDVEGEDVGLIEKDNSD